MEIAAGKDPGVNDPCSGRCCSIMRRKAALKWAAANHNPPACIKGQRSCNGGSTRVSTKRRKSLAVAACGKTRRNWSPSRLATPAGTEMATAKTMGTAMRTETDTILQPARRWRSKIGKLGRVLVGCDFGSTTAKAVCLSPDKELLYSCYALSRGNPIEDAKVLFRQLRDAIGVGEIAGLAITGYGKDLLKGILGADCPVVETIAHASAGLHFFPDADCICDVGGVDVKIMILNNGAVTDFRLNSQCSSGNGAFLQGVAERFDIPMNEMADRAFLAEAMPQLSMGCGVFLQSDIVNQQRKGWQADEILAALCAILPLNVWIYAGGLNNLKQVGRKYILQGGTHKNLAVVKTQVDFILSKIPEAEVVVHPYSGEAGAIGAALVALEWWEKGGQTNFRGFDAIERLAYKTVTSVDTVCHWCPVNCQRSFIDVGLDGGKGREWSKVPLGTGWERVIVNNSCPKDSSKT